MANGNIISESRLAQLRDNFVTRDQNTTTFIGRLNEQLNAEIAARNALDADRPPVGDTTPQDVADSEQRRTRVPGVGVKHPGRVRVEVSLIRGRRRRSQRVADAPRHEQENCDGNGGHESQQR